MAINIKTEDVLRNSKERVEFALTNGILGVQLELARANEELSKSLVDCDNISYETMKSVRDELVANLALIKELEKFRM